MPIVIGIGCWNNHRARVGAVENRKPNIWKIPKGFIERLTNLGDVLHLPLNSERLQKLTDSYIVSNNKIINAIGKPLPVSTRGGLLKTFKSFK